MLLIVSTSLSAASKSYQMALAALESARAEGQTVELLDLRSLSLPLCNGGDSAAHPDVQKAIQLVREASVIILAAPVHNYAVAASTKNFVELTGNEFRGKPVAMMMSCGSSVSYMAPTGLMASLILDFGCHIVPKIVMADLGRFSEAGALSSDEIRTRIASLVQATISLERALSLSGVGRR